MRSAVEGNRKEKEGGTGMTTKSINPSVSPLPSLINPLEVIDL